MIQVRNISRDDRARWLDVSGAPWGEIRVIQPDGTSKRVKHTRLAPPVVAFGPGGESVTPGGSCYVVRVPEHAEPWLDSEDLEIVGASEDLSWIGEIRSRKRMAEACAEHGVKYDRAEKLSDGATRLRAALSKSRTARK